MTAQLEDTTPIRRTGGRSTGRTKGILAIAVGTALLLGGGGTYAYWSTQQALTAGTVTTGDLNLGLGTPSWTLTGVLSPAAPVADPAAVRIVPGDTLTLTQPVTVTLVGNTIQANLAVNTGSIVPADVAQYVSVAFTAPGLGTPTGTNTYRVTPATAGTINATVTVTFSSSTPDRIAANTAVNLNNITFSLTQASS